LAVAEANDKALATELLGEHDDWRDDFDHKIDAARGEMRRLAGAAIVGTRAYQRHVVQIGLALVAIAVLLGIIVAAAVTLSLVRPVRRLLARTTAVEGGALDTVIPITSRDEIGRLTIPSTARSASCASKRKSARRSANMSTRALSPG
jgi:nitrogen fixation/metabolism regulation signal transduction histidine kinase